MDIGIIENEISKGTKDIVAQRRGIVYRKYDGFRTLHGVGLYGIASREGGKGTEKHRNRELSLYSGAFGQGASKVMVRLLTFSTGSPTVHAFRELMQ